MTVNTKQTASQILAQAADTLTEKEWTQGRLFLASIINGERVICRCAHGQIQWCGREASLQDKLRIAPIQDERGSIYESDDWKKGPSLNVKLIGQTLSLVTFQIDLQQALIRLRQEYPSYNEPLFIAHYYAMRVGLTTNFNDDPNRKFDEIILKLKEASLLAASEGN